MKRSVFNSSFITHHSSFPTMVGDSAMIAAHLTASTFYGGPERQMLGLARELSPGVRCIFLSFLEGGRCRAFLDEARKQGFPAQALRFDTPWFRAAIREL